MSIAYLDPGNIESDLQSGAKAGFQVIHGRLIELHNITWISFDSLIWPIKKKNLIK